MDVYNAINEKNAWHGNFYTGDEFISFEFENWNYSNLVSNSHVCPDNGKTNWGGHKKDTPRGYPGYSLRLSGKYKRNKKYNSGFPYTELFTLVGIKTCGGGGGLTSFQYSASIFLDDWPGLKQGMVVEKLKGIK
jgi:hypothetical protein